jgi:hypothetical protein
MKYDALHPAGPVQELAAQNLLIHLTNNWRWSVFVFTRHIAQAKPSKYSHWCLHQRLLLYYF